MRIAAGAHAFREEARVALLDPAGAARAMAAGRAAHRLQKTPRSAALLALALVAAGDREGALEVMMNGLG